MSAHAPLMGDRRSIIDRREASDTSWRVRGWHDFGEIATLNAALTRYQRGEDIDSPGVAPGLRSPIGLPAAGGLDTIGGLVFNILGHLPKAGERISLEDAELKVRRVVRARIQQVELRLKKVPEEEALAA